MGGLSKQNGVFQAYNQAVPLSGKKAMGGAVAGGRPYLVGERGPELMIPSGNGSIVPNNQLGGSGVTVVQNINVTTGVQQTVRAEIANLLPQISNAAKSAVADARMRGGGFSKAMVGA
jgi:phage-related minor tail protein